jgi:hypothetical protein
MAAVLAPRRRRSFATKSAPRSTSRRSRSTNVRVTSEIGISAPLTPAGREPIRLEREVRDKGQGPHRRRQRGGGSESDSYILKNARRGRAAGQRTGSPRYPPMKPISSRPQQAPDVSRFFPMRLASSRSRI